MADRIAVIRDGILQQVDTPQHLYDYPSNVFVAGFIGSPSMNFFDATITGTADEMYIDTGAFRIPVSNAIRSRLTDGAGKKVIFGIRPEDVFHPDYVSPGINAVKVESNVDVVELMGNEIFLYLVAADHAYIARAIRAVTPIQGTRSRWCSTPTTSTCLMPRGRISRPCSNRNKRRPSAITTLNRGCVHQDTSFSVFSETWAYLVR